MFAVRRLFRIHSFVHHVGRAAESQLPIAYAIHDGKFMRSAIQYAGQLARCTQIRFERYYSNESKSDSANDEKTAAAGSTQILSLEQPDKEKPNDSGSSSEKTIVLKRPVSPFSLYYRTVCGQLKRELGGPGSAWMLKAKKMFDELPYQEKMKFYDDYQLQMQEFRVANLKSPPKKPTTVEMIQLTERGLQRASSSFKRLQTILGFRSRVRLRTPTAYTVYFADKLRGHRRRLPDLRAVTLELSSQYSALDPATVNEYKERARNMHEANREIVLKYKEWRAALEHKYETQLQPDELKSDNPATKENRKRLQTISRYFRAEKRIQKLRIRLKILRQKLKQELNANATTKKNETESESATPKATRRKTSSKKNANKAEHDIDEAKLKTKVKAEKETKKGNGARRKTKQERKKPNKDVS